MDWPWRRLVLVLLAVPNLITGLWAILAPGNWFDQYPGWAPRLVAAYPPYNEHLATDAGAGLLATGVLAAYAAYALRREVTLTAMAGYVAFAGPHALYHLFNPADALSGAEDAQSTGLLLVAFAASAVLLVDSALRRLPDKEPVP